jgi:ribosomal protein S12 methylthiotransferase accessory factor
MRALTEVAQLAGDFETGSCYDPSGLSKPSSLEDCRWLESGPLTPLSDLPDIQEEDFLAEILNLKQCLADKGFSWYCLDTTHPDLDIPACYAVVPGFLFRERTERASLGLFIGRLLAEQYEPEEAERGLTFLEGLQPGAFYLPFYRGMIKLRSGELQAALEALEQAEGIQPSPEEQGLVAFYRGFAHSQAGQWDHCLPHLDRAIELSPHVHAYYNLRGVAHFKREDFGKAADDFQRALSLDSGSATDLANLGLCQQRLGNSQEAISCLQTSLELDPQLDFASKALQDLLTS